MRVLVSMRHDVVCGAGVRFRGMTTLDCRNGGLIFIGKGTTVNSSNHGYHVNMFARCKFMADRKNAILEIGENCRIHGTAIHAQKSIRIGSGCLIAANTQIFDGNAHELSLENPENRINSLGEAQPITIGNNVWIGTGAVILPGTNIGDGAVIGAMTVVRGEVPPNSLVAGNPGAVVKRMKRED